MRGVKRLAVRLAGTTLALIMTGRYLPALLTVRSLRGTVIAAALLTLANATLRPVLLFVAKPVNFVTIGLFTLVVDAAILEIVSSIPAGEVTTNSFLNSVGAAFIIGLAGNVAVSLFAGGE